MFSSFLSFLCYVFVVEVYFTPDDCFTSLICFVVLSVSFPYFSFCLSFSCTCFVVIHFIKTKNKKSTRDKLIEWLAHDEVYISTTH